LLEAGLSPTKGPYESALILRRAGIAALVVSISAGMTSNMLFLAAFQFRLDRFLEPTLILGSGAPSAELLRWAARYQSAETSVVRASNPQHPETRAPGDEVQRPSLPRGLRSALCTSSRREMLSKQPDGERRVRLGCRDQLMHLPFVEAFR
jgi:hypothetical protein